MYSLIVTWHWSLPAAQAGAEALRQGADAMDAAIETAAVVEADPTIDSVGMGGIPNCRGEVEVDAAVMDGKTLGLGAVAGIKHYMHPAAIARDVMEKTRHTFLVGQGAEEFAQKMGHQTTEVMTTPSSIESMKRYLAEDEANDSHDTVGIVALDEKGHMCTVTSTSGRGAKLPGRVGDTALVGSGYYVDEEVGGAAATGDGEDIMRGVLSFQIVELMRQGFTPQQAAEAALSRLYRRLISCGKHPQKLSVICMNRAGETGAASTFDGFHYSVASSSREPVLLHAPDVSKQ